MSFKPVYKLIDFVSNNFDKIDWENLSSNPNAIHLLEQNHDEIDWGSLSLNPSAIHLLEKYPNKIEWRLLSFNQNIFKLDCKQMKKNCQSFAEELASYVFNPARLHRFAEKYNLTFEEIMYTY